MTLEKIEMEMCREEAIEAKLSKLKENQILVEKMRTEVLLKMTIV
jgi:hypothetical protein